MKSVWNNCPVCGYALKHIGNSILCNRAPPEWFPITTTVNYFHYEVIFVPDVTLTESPNYYFISETYRFNSIFVTRSNNSTLFWNENNINIITIEGYIPYSKFDTEEKLNKLLMMS